MSQLVVTGILSDTLSGYTDFTINGFGTPAAALVITSEAHITGNPANRLGVSIGFWDGTNQLCVADGENDNVSSTQTLRRLDTNNIAAVGRDISSTPDSLYSISSITDGVRLTLNTDYTSYQRYASVLLLSNISGYAGSLTTNTTQNASVTSPNLGFTPSLILFAGVGSSTTNSSLTYSVLDFGFAQSGGEQVSFQRSSPYLVNPSAPTMSLRNNRCCGQTSTVNDWNGEVTDFGTGTFTLTTRDGSSAGDKVMYLALGGDGLQAIGNIFSTPTVTGTDTITTTGVNPDAVISVFGELTGTNYVESNLDGFSFGLSDGFNNTCYSLMSEDGVSPTNVNTTYSLGQTLNNATGTLISGQVGSFNTEQFSIDYTTVSPTSRYGWYLSFQDTTTGTINLSTISSTNTAAVSNIVKTYAGFSGFINSAENKYVIVKTIGTDPSRDYQSITDWMLDLSNSGLYTSSGNVALGVCYNDGPLYEDFTYQSLTTTQKNALPHDIYLTVEENSRHYGNLTGGLVVYPRNFLFWNYSPTTMSIEWMNFDYSYFTGWNTPGSLVVFSLIDKRSYYGNTFIRNCIFQNCSLSGTDYITLLSDYLLDLTQIGIHTGYYYNNLFYNVTSGDSSSAFSQIVSIPTYNTNSIVFNNTIHDCNYASRTINCGLQGNTTGYYINNLISTSCISEINFHISPTVDLPSQVLYYHNNASVDKSAYYIGTTGGGGDYTGVNSITGILDYDIYVSTGLGTEDFNLVDTSPAYNAGLVTGVITNLGSFFTQDIQGIQRGNYWNIGAYDAVDMPTSGTGTSNTYLTGIFNTYTSTLATLYNNVDINTVSNNLTDSSLDMNLEIDFYAVADVCTDNILGLSQIVAGQLVIDIEAKTSASAYVEINTAVSCQSETKTELAGTIYLQVPFSLISNTLTSLPSSLSVNRNNGEVIDFTVYLKTNQLFDLYLQTGYNSTVYINTGVTYELY